MKTITCDQCGRVIRKSIGPEIDSSEIIKYFIKVKYIDNIQFEPERYNDKRIGGTRYFCNTICLRIWAVSPPQSPP